MKLLRRAGWVVPALLLLSLPGWSSPILLQGSFTADNQVELFNVTLNTSGLLTVQSYGYAGGTVNAVVIAAGGFAPTVSLFDASGFEVASDSGGNCPLVGSDPTTGNCDDPYLQESLGPGTYTLALTEYYNLSDGYLPDGFSQAGSPTFTCDEFGLSGNFCDVTTALGTQRTGNYALSFTGADAATDAADTAVPEPGSWALLATGTLFFLFDLRRRRHLAGGI